MVCNIGELNQVFLNPIVTAAHAIGERDGDGKGAITIRTTRDGNDVAIAISDTGPGIQFEIQARIFDPFFTTKAIGRGTGQGLAISRSIVVDKHAGSLTVNSEPGRGSTFLIRLPVRSEATALAA